MPMVECSAITLCVPFSAASVMVTSWSNQGVVTSRSSPSSNWPDAPSTIYPTQSMSLTDICVFSSSFTDTASSGTNLGSAVMIVLPEPLWGSSSLALSRM